MRTSPTSASISARCSRKRVFTENVELVRKLQPAPDVDLAALWRDDTASAAVLEAMRRYIHEGLESDGPTLVYQGTVVGLEGLRETWLDWLSPWESYRTDVEDIIGVGDRVVVLVRDRARRPGMSSEVTIRGAAIWTVRDGKVVGTHFYTDRAEALADAGLTGT